MMITLPLGTTFSKFTIDVILKLVNKTVYQSEDNFIIV